jgi:type II secretory pathway component PulM
MRNNSLRREITIVLLLKTILLSALWYLFFSQPLARDLDAGRVSQALIESVSHPAIPAKEVSRHDH